MQFSVPPPLITSQMPWWQAGLLFSLLPLAGFVFRWFARGPMAYSFHHRHTLRIGIAVATVILGTGFISSGYALVGLLNYIQIDEQGIRQVKFLKPQNFQRWQDLVSADKWEETSWKWGRRDDPLRQVTGFDLQFKENGRWQVVVQVKSNEFRGDDFQRFNEWLKTQMVFQSPPPPPPNPYLPEVRRSQ